jgi:CelD/BcsL family acetyltransferase involved in cellulose biosynthesis
VSEAPPPGGGRTRHAGPLLETPFPYGALAGRSVPFRDKAAGSDAQGDAMSSRAGAATQFQPIGSAFGQSVSTPAERRLSARKPPLVTADGVRVEAIGFDVASLHREAWLDLAEHAAEPNPFLDPDFALAAARHLPMAHRPIFVVARGLVGGRMRMMGLLALESGRRRLSGAAAGWEHPYMALGAPLLGTARAAEALEGLLAWVGANVPRAGALLIPSLTRDGATAQLLRRGAMAHGRGFRLLDPRARAVARFDEEGAPPVATKELRRLWRRLGEQGALDFRVVDDPVAVRNGLEQFLVLEAAGWKGERGTAMLSDSRAAAFARSAVRLMARRGAARLAALTLEGCAIAIGVVLISGRQAAFWKIAHDPAFARFSPGVQLSLRLAEHCAADPRIEAIDSCASENHPMIDRIWPQRLAVADAMAALPSGPGAAGARYRLSVARETARRNARILAKRAFLAISGRKST